MTCPHALVLWHPSAQSADPKVAPAYWPKRSRCVVKGPHTAHKTVSGKEWS